MQNERIISMIKGALAGSAIGLPFQGHDPMLESEAKEIPTDTFAKMPKVVVGSHPPSSWSSLIEQLFLATQSLRENPEILKEVVTVEDVHKFTGNFASKLNKWVTDGAANWGPPHETEFQTLAMSKVPGFTEKPLHLVPTQPQNANDCSILLRALLAATQTLPDQAERIATLLSGTTHSSRSLSTSCIIISLLLQSTLYNTREKRKEVMDYVGCRIDTHCQGTENEKIYTALSAVPLSHIGGRDFIGRHLSSLRCFMHAYRICVQSDADPVAPTDLGAVWTTIMRNICLQGGSSGINGALAGAMMGAYFGPDIVPDWVEQLPNYSWVSDHIKLMLMRTEAPTIA